MFGSSEQDKLENKYKKLMEESFQLSRTNRRKSDEKMAEAEEIRQKLDALKESNS